MAIVIDKDQFLFIRERHGTYASWAVWAQPSGRPKSNMGDMSILDENVNASLLQTLRNDVVMAGLNISRTFSEPFRNFHDPSPWANDFKIRYAFADTKYYGSYMTDIIKNVEMVKSTDLLAHLRNRPALIRENADKFREELRDLRSSKPIILAFGNSTYRLIAENVPGSDYSQLIKLTHYSHQISKEHYRDTVLAQIIGC
jgi:hypothetical protein